VRQGQGAPDDRQISIRDDLSVPLGVLKQGALRTARGQKIAYIVDIAYHQASIEKAIALARDADQLFIEAPFLEVDVDFAARSRHLTARQAGDIARCAHVARLIPFHFSARYRERENELLCEAETAFSAGSACGSILYTDPARFPQDLGADFKFIWTLFIRSVP